MDVRKYNNKRFERQSELISEVENNPDYDKDLYNLEMMLLNISPYSKAWRWGYIKSLKRAIKLIKQDNQRKEKM